MNHYDDLVIGLEYETAFILNDGELNFLKQILKEPQTLSDFLKDKEFVDNYSNKNLDEESSLLNNKALKFALIFLANQYANGDESLKDLLKELIEKNIGISKLVPILKYQGSDMDLINLFLTKVDLIDINDYFLSHYDENDNFDFGDIQQKIINKIGDLILTDFLFTDRTKLYATSTFMQNHPDNNSEDKTEKQDIPLVFPDVANDFFILELIDDFSLLEKMLQHKKDFRDGITLKVGDAWTFYEEKGLMLEDFLYGPKLNSLLNNPKLPQDIRKYFHQMEIDPYCIKVKDEYLIEVVHENITNILFDNPLAFERSETHGLARKYVALLVNDCLTESQELDLAYKIKNSKQSISYRTPYCLDIGSKLALHTKHPNVLCVLDQISYLKGQAICNPNYPIDKYNSFLENKINEIENYVKNKTSSQTAYNQYSLAQSFIEGAFRRHTTTDYKIPENLLDRIKSIKDMNISITAIVNGIYPVETCLEMIKKHIESDRLKHKLLDPEKEPFKLRKNLALAIAITAARKTGLDKDNITICGENFLFLNPDDTFLLGKVKTLDIADELKISEYEKFVENLRDIFVECELNEQLIICDWLLDKNQVAINSEREMEQLKEMIENEVEADFSSFDKETISMQLEQMITDCLNIYYNRNQEYETADECQLYAYLYAYKHKKIYSQLYKEFTHKNNEERELLDKQQERN